MSLQLPKQLLRSLFVAPRGWACNSARCEQSAMPLRWTCRSLPNGCTSSLGGGYVFARLGNSPKVWCDRLFDDLSLIKAASSAGRGNGAWAGGQSSASPKPGKPATEPSWHAPMLGSRENCPASSDSTAFNHLAPEP